MCGIVGLIVFVIALFGLRELSPRLRDQLMVSHKDRVSATAPKALGAANFAALSAPTPELSKALATLSAVGPEVAQAATDSPKQWRTYFFVGVAGEVVFIPLILLMAGFWDPRKAKVAEQEHEARIAAEMETLRGATV